VISETHYKKVLGPAVALAEESDPMNLQYSTSVGLMSMEATTQTHMFREVSVNGRQSLLMPTMRPKTRTSLKFFEIPSKM
jgi:hypothetical protein